MPVVTAVVLTVATMSMLPPPTVGPSGSLRGSGTGVSIVANKLRGVRAVNARDAGDAEMARRHNDANVLALAGRKLDDAEAVEIIDAFLEAGFEGGRHQRRVDQIARIENGELPAEPLEATKEAN